MSNSGHIPVLMNEVLDILRPGPGDVVVDCTLGRGGHAMAMGERIGPTGHLLGLDLDGENLTFAADRLAEAGINATTIHDSFARVSDHVLELGRPATIVLADLGVSSNQLDDPNRGFGFREDAPLDMRLDQQASGDLKTLLATIDQAELERLIGTYGEEPFAGRIARKIALERQSRPITTTGQLARLVRDAYGARARSSRLHPATRTFMALRIALNDEIAALETLLDRIGRGMEASDGWLAAEARVGIISFHSLEDRPVKQAFAELDRRGLARRLTRRPVRPTATEAQANPRSRSAKFRAIGRGPAGREGVQGNAARGDNLT